MSEKIEVEAYYDDGSRKSFNVNHIEFVKGTDVLELRKDNGIRFYVSVGSTRYVKQNKPRV